MLPARQTFAALAFVCALTGFGGALHAQSKTLEADSPALAHIRKGEALLNAKKYEQAIREFERAYAITPLPELALNIGQIHRVAGNLRAAVEYYERFLRDAGTHDLAKEAARILVEVKLELDQKQAQTRARQAEHARKRRLALRNAQRSGRVLRILGLSAMGLSTIAIGIGIKLAVDAHSLERDIDRHVGPWTHPLLDKFATGERTRNRARWVGGVGAGLFTTGVVAYLIGRRQRTNATERARNSFRIAPFTAPRTVGIAVSGML